METNLKLRILDSIKRQATPVADSTKTTQEQVI